MNFVTRVRNMDSLDWMTAVDRGFSVAFKTAILLVMLGSAFVWGALWAESTMRDAQCFTFPKDPPLQKPTEMPVPR